MQKQSEKGLCFNCDKKFTPGHRCKTIQVFLIEPMKEEEGDGEEVGADVEEVEFSVHAIVETQGPKTTKMEAWVKERHSIMVIYNGSSHNFITHDVTK